MSTHWTNRRVFATSFAAGAFFLGSLATAGAQTTVTLNAPDTQVTDVMIQAGASADANFNKSDVLATQAGASADALRRALLKFDTQNTIPGGTKIQSAVMTLTVKVAGADTARTIGVYPVTTSFVQEDATWNRRRAGYPWVTLGGDLGPQSTAFTAPNAAGTKVNVDVTALVQSAISGASSSRYTRLALVDTGAASNGSDREFFSSKALDPSVRPVLTVVYGGTNTVQPPPPPPVQSAEALPACTVGLDKAAFTVGTGQADWSINVTAAATCAWSATSDASWLVVKSTMPATATGNGYAKMRAAANTTSAAKRIGHVSVNGTVYTVTQGGCGSSCTPPPVVNVIEPPTSVTLRVLQYNTHHGGWSSATTPVYDPNKIVDWVMKANPDIISMNEIEVGTSWSQGLDQSDLYKSLLEQRTGITWYKEFVNVHGPASTSGNGNLVLSKYPIIATGSHLLPATRAAVDVTIAVNGRNINFTATHMDNVSATNRVKETDEVMAWETTFAEDRIICGDWNAWPGSNEIVKMEGSYVETWKAARALGTAIGNGITHGSHQIDYIFLSKGAAHTTLKSVQIFATADANGIMPSDHQPVLAVFDVQ